MDDRRSATILRTLLWQGIAWPGTEWCELSRDAAGWRITGIVLTAVAAAPVQVRYAVQLDGGWATQEVQVEMRSGAGQAERRLHLDVGPDRVWRATPLLAGEPAEPPTILETVRGLFDVDLGFSPATNTLPIRRLAPAIGESVDVTAVWVRFPELTIEPLPQRYTRLDERRYRYESRSGAFVAELEVDELGLVIDYEGGWRRIATSGPA